MLKDVAFAVYKGDYKFGKDCKKSLHQGEV